MARSRTRAERTEPSRRPPAAVPAAAAAPEPAPRRGSPAGRAARAVLSALVPGLGQAFALRPVEAALFFVGAAVPYLFFLALLNTFFGVPGELAALSFLDAEGPLRPPPEHWALLLVGVLAHATSVWHAAART